MNSHDVRKLKVCILCKGLGMYQSAKDIAPTLVNVCPDAPKNRRQFCHPRCYMEEMGTAKLLSLPKAELKYIRMCDVPIRTMHRIVQQVGR